MTRATNRPGCRGARIAIGVAIGAAAWGCSAGPIAPPESGKVEVDLALVVSGGLTVTSVQWELRAADGSTAATGTIDVNDPAATPSVTISARAGASYVLSMSTVTREGVACAGTSLHFNVVAGQTVAVFVSLICGGGGSMQRNGAIVGTGTVVEGDNCPVITSASASPLRTSQFGGQIDVAVTASDADPGDVLSYSWTAAAGVFADRAAPATQYICGEGGPPMALTVVVSDNHAPSPCTVTRTFMVTCLLIEESFCQRCEASHPDVCLPELVQVPGTGASGCEGFSGLQLTSCNALLACIRGQGPGGACAAGDDPTPCVCDGLDVGSCVQGPLPPQAACAAEYLAAAGGIGPDVLMHFYDPATPVGIADNLLACDVDAGCVQQCNIRLASP
jgi:hypothetical protein